MRAANGRVLRRIAAAGTGVALGLSALAAAPAMAMPASTTPASTTPATATTASATGSDPAPRPAFRLDGVGGGPMTLDGYEGHRIRFEIHASGDPGRTQGSFHVTHWLPDGSVLADFEGRADCVSAHRGTAVATGIVEKVGTAPDGIEIPTGKRVGFMVADVGRHHDRLGWSWAYEGFQLDLPKCMGTIPFHPVLEGDYAVGGAVT